MDLCCTELYQNRTETAGKVFLTPVRKLCSQAANMAARTSGYGLRVDWTCIGKGPWRTAVNGFGLLNSIAYTVGNSCLVRIFIRYKPTKCTFSKLISLIFSCLLHVSKPRVHLHQDGCIYRLVYHVLPTRLLIPMYVKRTILYLYIQPSSWRRTLAFETCRRHKKLKILV